MKAKSAQCLKNCIDHYPSLIGMTKRKFLNFSDRILSHLKANFKRILSELHDYDEIFLTLMMFQTKFDLMLVSKMFNIDKVLAVKIFCFYVCFISKYMKSVPLWRILEFAECTEKLIVLQVCTVNVQLNRSIVLNHKMGYLKQRIYTQSQISEAKSFKYMVALTDTGHVLFCSRAMSASLSDGVICESSNGKFRKI